MSGNSPPGPSIVGANPKASVERFKAFRTPKRISLVFADFRQSKVLLVVASEAHEGTPATKFFHSTCRFGVLAGNSIAVAAEPDSNI